MGGDKSAKPAAASSSSDERISERQSPPLPKVAPWLVFPYQAKGKKQNQAFYNICEPNKRSCRKFIPELSGKSFWQKHSHQGWLTVICDDKNYNYGPNWKFGDCFLWNPASLETVQLPSLLPWCSIFKPYEQCLVDCVLSSPLSTVSYDLDNSDHPMVLMLYVRDYRDFTLVFCHPGDKTWRSKRVLLQGRRTRIWSLCTCFQADKLYFICEYDDDGHQAVAEIDKGKLWDNDDDSLTLRLFKITYNNETWSGSVDNIQAQHFYVESSVQLYKVEIYYHWRQNIKVFNTVVVMRLDLSSKEWKLVTCLGDDVLFIGEHTRACCSASKLGLTTGCLYYTLPKDQCLYKYEVQNSGNSVILPCLELPTPWFPSDWIMIVDGKEEDDDWIMIRDGKEEDEDCIEKAVENELKPTSAPSITMTSYNLFPWLMFCVDNNDAVYNFVSPAVHDNKNSLLKFSEFLLGATVCFQKGGWLLMSREDIVFFFNPFTREVINLPDLPEDYFSSGMCFSSLPTSADCTVFSFDEAEEETISFCTITRGKQAWDRFKFDNAILYSPVCNPPVLRQGVFYCIDYDGILGTFNLKDNTWKVHGTPRNSYSGAHPYHCFMVESGEDLLLVKLGCEEKLVRVFKLNFSVMDWVEVDSLGKHMLFISDTSCSSAIAPSSQMENKIYLPRLCLNGEEILFYSLDTGRYDSFGGQHSSKDLYETKGWRANCTWIEPNWSKFTPQELNWFEPPF